MENGRVMFLAKSVSDSFGSEFVGTFNEDGSYFQDLS